MKECEGFCLSVPVTALESQAQVRGVDSVNRQAIPNLQLLGHSTLNYATSLLEKVSVARKHYISARHVMCFGNSSSCLQDVVCDIKHKHKNYL
jgi:hypothetical protein